MRKLKYWLVCVVTVPVVAAPVHASAAGGPLSADMRGGFETPPVATTGQGVGNFKLVPRKHKICFTISFLNLSSPTTAAHIHRGDLGVAGDIVVPLFSGPQTSPADGCAKHVSKKLLNEIQKDPQAFYCNVHTDTHPAGEIRGQLQRGTRV